MNEIEWNKFQESYKNDKMRILSIYANGGLITESSMSSIRVTKESILFCRKNDLFKDMALPINLSRDKIKRINTISLDEIIVGLHDLKECVFETFDDVSYITTNGGVSILPSVKRKIKSKKGFLSIRKMVDYFNYIADFSLITTDELDEIMSDYSVTMLCMLWCTKNGLPFDKKTIIK